MRRNVDPGNTIRARRSRPQRRALGIPLAPETLSLVPRLRRLAESLLEAPAGPPSPETVALRAVLGTIIWSGLTLPGLCEGLSVLRRDQLDLDKGVLTLTTASSPPQRFHLDPRSTTLWAWLLLLRVQEPDWQEHSDLLVLPPHWRDPRRLRAGVEKIITRAGLDSWTAFNSAVQLRLACDGVPPIVIWRREGHLFVTPEPTFQLPALAAPMANGSRAESSRITSKSPALGKPPSETLSPPWREPVKQILRGLRRRGPGHTRRQMAADLEKLLCDARWAQEAGIIGPLFCRWAITLLGSSLRQNSVRAYLSRVGRALDADLVSDALMSAESAETTACVQRGVELYQTHESRRSVLRALRTFLMFVGQHGHPIGRNVKWQRITRTIGGTARAEPLLSPAEIRAASSALQQVGPDGLALAVAIVLGGSGGLRRAEICHLTEDDVQSESDWAICVRRSKTKAGARRVPLGRLAPSWALEILGTYHAYRATLETTCRTWLVTGSGTPWDPDLVGERVSRVLREVSGKPATFHSLRRACATWWLVCWISVDRGWAGHPELIAAGPPAAGVLAVLGKDPSLALWSLARLLGHIAPAVTVERYVLAMDWIEAQVFSGEAGARITRRMAAEILTVTERRARDLVAFEDGSTSLDTVLAVQRRRLRLQAGRQ